MQLDLFEPPSKEQIELYEMKRLQEDIARMRRSFFVRLDAHERKYQQIIEKLEARK